MDSRTFDRLSRLFGAAATRRGALAALFGAAASTAASGALASRKRRSDRPGDSGADAAGPCGDGSRKDNRCTNDKQCCTGICDIELGK
ncbi:MAG: hypothetical protein ACKOWF_18440, partial [Chloroflexota bacterium]